ncbi:MAG: hypothetical protein HQL30_03505 [Candidatus Omnitrophica bacterium]|nr:hypothetical protein [Candidatus Omnitrophota bacterium]
MISFQKPFVRGSLTFVLLLVVFLLRLSLINKGQFFFPDEFRYNMVYKAYGALVDGHFRDAFYNMFHSQGRPGFIAACIPIAAVQQLLVKLRLITPYGYHFPCVVSFFNVAVSVGALYLFYRIIFVLSGERRISFLGAGVYALLCNSNIYLRHIFPYDMAISIFFLALYLYLRVRAVKEPGISIYALCGILSALSFLVYPGYCNILAFFGIVFILLKDRILPGILVYFVSAGCVISITEVISRIAGRPYLADLAQLSGTATQGTFSESLVFIVKYLLQVEGPAGAILICGFLAYVISRTRKDILKFTPDKSVITAALILYLYHGILGVFFNKVVFYGRLIHFYIPMLVIALVLAIKEISLPGVRRLAVWTVAGTSIISFLIFFRAYFDLEYPRYFIYKNTKNCPRERITRIDETGKQWETGPGHDLMLLVNTNFLSPIKKDHFPLEDPKGLVLASSSPHPLTFKAYLFEGFSVEERKWTAERKYRMKMFLPEKVNEMFKNMEKR